MKMKVFLIALLSLALTACSGCSTSGVASDGTAVPLTQEQKIDLVCTGVTAAVKAITYADASGALDKKLGAEGATRLRSEFLVATAETDKVCGVKPYPTLSAAKMIAFEDAAGALRSLVNRI